LKRQEIIMELLFLDNFFDETWKEGTEKFLDKYEDKKSFYDLPLEETDKVLGNIRANPLIFKGGIQPVHRTNINTERGIYKLSYQEYILETVFPQCVYSVRGSQKTL